ncbi:MAG TPA: hypothetical protein DIW31_04010 [Bacteroidales bacterium]|nr:hypothetical protein [Bacteroidales bacterium]
MFCLFSFKTACSQEVSDSSKFYKVETVDGNEYVGHIIIMNSDYIRLKTANLGEITINQKDVTKLSVISKERVSGGGVSYGELHSSRYFTTSNGYGLKKGSGYYQNMWIFYNQFGYGFTDNFSISAGVVPLFLFAGASSPVWITPKVSIPLKKDKVNLGAGILVASVLGEDNEAFGYGYGVITFGSGQKNLSIGLGYGYYGNSWSDRPTISLCFKIPAGKRGYVMAENYFLPIDDERVMLSLIGGRSLIRKVALDYGLVIPVVSGMEQFVAIPWLGVTIPLGED